MLKEIKIGIMVEIKGGIFEIGIGVIVKFGIVGVMGSRRIEL